jgi:hypothetical protein
VLHDNGSRVGAKSHLLQERRVARQRSSQSCFAAYAHTEQCQREFLPARSRYKPGAAQHGVKL